MYIYLINSRNVFNLYIVFVIKVLDDKIFIILI